MNILSNIKYFDWAVEKRTQIFLEEEGFPGIREFVKVVFNSSNGPLPPHIHPDAIEICFVAKGHQIYSAGDTNYDLHRGMVFVSHTNELHHSNNYVQEKGVMLFYMIIDVIHNKENFLGLSGDGIEDMVDALAHMPYSFNFGEKYTNQFDEIIELFEKRPPQWRTRLRCALFILLNDMVQRAQYKNNMDRMSLEIIQLLDYIEDNLTSVHLLTTSAMAKRFYMSEQQFIKRFSTEVGQTPKKYIMSRRIWLAQDMLLDGKSITEVAFELGFSSSQHFTNQFKALCILSPSQWLKNNKSTE